MLRNRSQQVADLDLDSMDGWRELCDEIEAIEAIEGIEGIVEGCIPSMALVELGGDLTDQIQSRPFKFTMENSHVTFD